MPAAVDRQTAATDDVVRAVRRTFLVQVRYPRSQWVTLARIGNRRTALRAAGVAYRDAVSADGSTPSQVRVLER